MSLKVSGLLHGLVSLTILGLPLVSFAADFPPTSFAASDSIIWSEDAISLARLETPAATIPAKNRRSDREEHREAGLPLKSSVALVVDQDTDEILYEKNAQAVLPIASITKLMTALVTIEADLSLDEVLVVTREDRTVDRVRSSLRPGVRVTRAQALQLALMSSENHAAQLLGRTYPGGLEAFIEAMNARAQLLGMHDSHFADPTGLSPDNRSSPADLVKLVKAGYEYEAIRDFSTASGLALPIGKRLRRYGNTNRLIANPDWEIGLQKTGYISAAGRCLVMQAVIEGRRVVMVLLHSAGKYSRLGDAQRIRTWLRSRIGRSAAPHTEASIPASLL